MSIKFIFKLRYIIALSHGFPTIKMYYHESHLPSELYSDNKSLICACGSGLNDMFAKSSDCSDLVSSRLDNIFQLYYAIIHNIDNLILAAIYSIEISGNKTPLAL